MRTLLFTDVVDSTRVVERLGDARAAEIWAAHDRRGRALLVRHRGREIDRTDGFFLLFDEPADAASYALGYHAALAELGLSARVGIHVGAVTLRENTPEDIAHGAKPVETEGLAKPLAARIMALAGGGQTLLSAAAREALAEIIPDGAAIESHGHYRLKGIEEPVGIFELGTPGASPFSPPADVDKAHRVIQDGNLWRPVREVRHNLPAERDAFVGRNTDLRALAARLDAGSRLITVLGPGGTGKTRFVRRYGWSWLGDWPGGVYFCDLSDAKSLDAILGAVAVALGIPLGKDDPGVQLGHAIAGRGRCLVILDNFEQIVAHAADTVGRWLDRAVEASFVVTSRERLHLPGEELLPLEPLPVTMDAIDLFVARARAQLPDFVLGDGNRAAVAEAVRLLDGLPLAIELAAARVRVLSPAQLVVKLRDRFQVLAGARGASARQATLRTAIDWSWDLLAPWEQAAFAQCSVFEGGFTLEAAEAVLELSPWPDAPSAMDAIQALVDKSLLRTWVPSDRGRYDIEEPYFGMYISIHEYAEEKLRASSAGAERACEERHGRYFARFGTEDALEALLRHGGVQRRGVLALELENLVAACRRATGRGDGAVAIAAYRAAWEVLEFHGPFTLGVALGVEVLALPGVDASLRAAAALTLALALRRTGRIDEARTRLTEAQSVAVAAGDRRLEVRVLGSLGILHREQGRMHGSTRTARAGPAHRPRGGRPPHRGPHPHQPGPAPPRAGPHRRGAGTLRGRAGHRPRDGQPSRRGHRPRQPRPSVHRAGPGGTGAATPRGRARHRARGGRPQPRRRRPGQPGPAGGDQGLRDESAQAHGGSPRDPPRGRQPAPRRHRPREPGRQCTTNKVARTRPVNTSRPHSPSRTRWATAATKVSSTFALACSTTIKAEATRQAPNTRLRLPLPARWATASAKAWPSAGSASLHAEGERLAEAGLAYEQALALARDGGYRRLEGRGSRRPRRPSAQAGTGRRSDRDAARGRSPAARTLRPRGARRRCFAFEDAPKWLPANVTVQAPPWRRPRRWPRRWAPRPTPSSGGSSPCSARRSHNPLRGGDAVDAIDAHDDLAGGPVIHLDPQAGLDPRHRADDRLPGDVERDAALVLLRGHQRLLDALGGVGGVGRAGSQGEDEGGQGVARGRDADRGVCMA